MKNITQKLVKILGAVARVKKNGFNAHQKYQYATEADIMDAVKEALIENSVFITESSRVLDIKDLVKDGKTSFITTVETTHTFIDADSGESLSVTSVGQGHDSLDKGVYKAITGANKYFLVKNFLISTGDDPENDGATTPVVNSKPAPIKTGGFATQVKTSPVQAALVTPQPKSPVTKPTAKDMEEPDFL
jgi:hypothetical protein